MKEKNTHLLYKGEVKIKTGSKVFETKTNTDLNKRKVQVNKNTWIYTSKESDQKAIADYNERYSV